MFSKHRNHAFDLYRALAVLAVVIGHIGLHIESIQGWIKICLVIPINYGVPLFFIISGYLLAGSITYLRKTPQITYVQSLQHFYYLRICRIYPAYIFWLFILWIWGIFANENKYFDITDLLVHIFNIHNIFQQYCRSINPVFWSLAVEFQWYLLAPALFYLMLDKSIRVMTITFGIILIISISLRNWLVWNFFADEISITELWRLSNEQIYIELYSFGLGIIIWRFRKARWKLSNINMIFIWIGMLLIAFYTYSFYYDIDGGVTIIGSDVSKKRNLQLCVITNLKYVSQILLTYIVFHYRNISLPQLFYPSVQFIAKISYSLYIVHYPILTAIIAMEKTIISDFAVYFILTFGVSTISYILIEKPFIVKTLTSSIVTNNDNTLS